MSEILRLDDDGQYLVKKFLGNPLQITLNPVPMFYIKFLRTDNPLPQKLNDLQKP